MNAEHAVDIQKDPSSLISIDENQIEGENTALLHYESTSYSNDHQVESTWNNNVDELYEPFVRPDYPIGHYEKFKLIFNGIFLLPIRVIIIGFLCILFWIISKLTFIGLEDDKRTFRYLHGTRRALYLIAGYLCRIGLFFAGFYTIERYHVTQKQMDKIRSNDLKIKNATMSNTCKYPPCTIICNHISMIDIIILLSEFNIVSFLALDRLKDTIFFGEWMKQSNCLFVTEEKKNLVTEIQNRQKEYHHLAESNQDPSNLDLPTRLVIFPEGTTTNGSYHIMFHRGAFTAGLPVQPFVIRYPWKHFCPSWETIPLSTYYLRLLTQFRTYVRVIYFPVYYPSPHEMKDPAVYASNVRHVMTKCTNRLFPKCDREQYRGGLEIVKVGNQSRKNKVALHKRILDGEFEWTKNKNFP